MDCLYVKNEHGEYHGGFPIYLSCAENKYLGGNHEMIVSRYNNMVVPVGLYHRSSQNDPEDYEENQWNHQINHEYDNDDEYETMNESQCIHPELFDKLLEAVRIQESKKRKHKNNKTKKHKK